MLSAVVTEDFKDDKKAEYIEFVEHLGSNISFFEDRWVCDKLRRAPFETTADLTIHFGRIPKQFREMVKCFSAIRFIHRISLTTVKMNITDLTRFFDFWLVKCKNAGLYMLNESVAVGFYQYLNEHGWSESTAFKGCITIFGVQVLW